MGKDINVYVLSHKMPHYGLINDEWHTPIHVGAALSNDKFCETKDNTGDNISAYNKLFLETTGIYWAWKNGEKSEYVGQEHYRRHFNLTKELALDILKTYDIIVPSPLELGSSVEDQYKACHIADSIEECERIIAEEYPEYISDYTKYIKNSNVLYYANSYITSWENYEKINEFVFGVLFELCNRKGFLENDILKKYVEESNQTAIPDDHKKAGMTWVDYQSEICAFLAERLTSLCIMHNFNKRYEVKFQEVEQEWKNKNSKTLLCCIGRMENQYIREFVNYYKALGVTNICLYDNNRDGEEDFHDSIGKEIEDGFVILKDYRNRPAPCQLDAYNECYQEYKDEYDWFLYFDIDEFLYLTSGKKIGEYLSLRKFDGYDMIHVNWLIYGDGGELRNDGRGLLSRITKPIDINKTTLYSFPDNFHVKTIVRGGLEDMIWQTTPHTPFISGKCCNASGLECDKNSPFSTYDFREAALLHYTTKTAEEYAEKVKRGFCDTNRTNGKELIEIFFKRNEVTQEKIDIFKEKTGIDMSYLLPKTFDGEKRKDVQIFSLCFAKKDFQFLDDAVITPLQVGAAYGNDVCKLKDNDGDNISGANYFYIEGTGTYWIWKNIHDAQYKGQMQYRRPLSGISETTDFETIFKDYDVITCEPFNHPSHKIPTKEEPMFIPADTVEQGYAFSNCIDDLNILEMAVKMYHPEYAQDWDKYIKNGEDLYYSNGFIMKAEDYDKYSEFLFSSLNGYLAIANIHTQNELIDHVRYNLEVGKYPRYKGNNVPPEAVKWQTEIGGFLSERLWTLWVQHNFPKERIYKLPYVKMEKNMYT